MPRYLYDVTNLHTQTPEVKSGKRRKVASHNKIDPADIAVCLTCSQRNAQAQLLALSEEKRS